MCFPTHSPRGSDLDKGNARDFILFWTHLIQNTWPTGSVKMVRVISPFFFLVIKSTFRFSIFSLQFGSFKIKQKYNKWKLNFKRGKHHFAHFFSWFHKSVYKTLCVCWFCLSLGREMFCRNDREGRGKWTLGPIFKESH
jgi:hypothetical protein